MMSKPLLATISFLFAMCVLFGYLSYSFYGQKQAMETQLNITLESNSSLEKSLSKQEKACKIGDAITSEFIEENKLISLQTNDDLSKIDKLKVIEKQNGMKPGTMVNSALGKRILEAPHEKTNVVGLDGSLPNELVSVLAEGCNRAKGSACDDPR